MSENTGILLETKDLSKYFTAKKGLLNRNPSVVKAVDHVSLSVRKGETLGLVGESGCGKSTLGRTILRLIPATEGQVMYNGEDILTYDKKEMRRKLQIIFQDPYSSLNPRMTVYDLISAPLEVYKVGTKEERREMVEEILQEVGLDKQYLNRFPHEFSGGQRQRIGIARALILNPEFVVCDEAVSALDVSVQQTIIELIVKLQKEKNITIGFICHDISLIQSCAHEVAVMYLGNVVEVLPAKNLSEHAVHPYTRALIGSIFDIGMDFGKPIEEIKGEAPSPLDVPAGCPFRGRCPKATEKCAAEKPKLHQIGADHEVACHLFDKEDK